MKIVTDKLAWKTKGQLDRNYIRRACPNRWQPMHFCLMRLQNDHAYLYKFKVLAYGIENEIVVITMNCWNNVKWYNLDLVHTRAGFSCNKSSGWFWKIARKKLCKYNFVTHSASHATCHFPQSYRRGASAIVKYHS